jgi:hypothetical protein
MSRRRNAAAISKAPIKVRILSRRRPVSSCEPARNTHAAHATKSPPTNPNDRAKSPNRRLMLPASNAATIPYNYTQGRRE